MVREVLIVRPSACRPPPGTRPEVADVAQRIGGWLATADRRPDAILAAADRPSRRLAEGAARVVGLSAAAVGHTPRLRGVGWTLLAALEVLDGERVLAVGEVPGVDLPRAPVISIRRDGDAGLRVGEVVRHTDLPDSFPFPTLSGIEHRPRPAYTYYQAGAIPYRQGARGPEILLITNRKDTRWLVPKGIHEPGFSAQQSAAKEAFEEAGVLGDVEDVVVGSYGVRKWGGTCTVTLFPLHVHHVLPEDAWEESHRRRRWVRALRAPRKIHKRALADLVDRFARTLSPGR